MIDKLIIDEHNIVPGQNAVLKLNVAKLPSGTDIHLSVHIFRSREPGPSVLITGGMHGDEVNGVEIVRRAIVHRYFDNLKCGSVIAIPLINIYGFINFSRDVVDGKDVNRSFPGNINGSLASQVAHTLTNKILPLVDFGMDFHTGGASRYNYPQVRYSKKDDSAKALAKAFAAPYILPRNVIDKSFRKAAADMGKPIIVFEGGETLRYDAFSLNEGLNGMRRVLASKGMIDKEGIPAQEKQIVMLKRATWIRASRSGLFLWHIDSGNYVDEGELLGTVNDPYGNEEVPILANKSGYIFGHNNAPVVNRGDALFHIGYDFEEYSED